MTKRQSFWLALALWLIGSIGLPLLFYGCGPPDTTVETNGRKPSPTPSVRHITPRPVPTPKIKPSEPEASRQQELWRLAKIKPQFQISVDKAVMLYLRTRGRYEVVEHARPNGVPATVLFGLHMRESDNSFTRHLHEGSSLLARTRYVPKNRPPPPAQPPFDWTVSAIDAVYVADRMAGDWWSLTWSLNKIRDYNGRGYDKLGIPSPYLWSGTQNYSRGKFVSDGRFSATAVDQQIGVCAVLLRMKQRGIEIPFDP